jgi:glutamate carboxypeptidase
MQYRTNIAEQTFQTIDENAEKYLDFLYQICSFEARAYDKQTIDRMVDYIQTFAQDEGMEVKRTPMEKCGDFLTVEINPGAEKGCLFQAHMDTVHEKGIFGEPPVRRDESRIYGPGVIDCKGGITIALLTMKTLLDSGFKKHVRLLLTSDEEISNVLGGAREIQLIKDSAIGFPYAINCETAENNEVVIARKAILQYRLDIKGVSGHSGKHYFTSKNARVFI